MAKRDKTGIILVRYVEWGQACILTYNYITLYNDKMARKPRIEFPGAFYHVKSICIPDPTFPIDQKPYISRPDPAFLKGCCRKTREFHPKP